MKPFTRRAALPLGGAAADWIVARSFHSNLPVLNGTTMLAPT